jgi:hypothetical protein
VDSGDGSISRPVNPDLDPDQQNPGTDEPLQGVALATSPGSPIHPRLQAMILAARHHGVEAGQIHPPSIQNLRPLLPSRERCSIIH